MAFSCSAGYELNFDAVSIRDGTDKIEISPTLSHECDPRTVLKLLKVKFRSEDVQRGNQASCLAAFCHNVVTMLRSPKGSRGTSPIGLLDRARPWPRRHMRP